MKHQHLTALVFVFVASVASAQTIENSLAACAVVSDQQQRLECFDALARDVGASPGSRALGQSKTPSNSRENVAPPVTSTDESSMALFGLEHKDPNAVGPSELSAVVSGIRKSALGRMTLTLDNGQVWQQKDDKTLILHEGDAVLIERGFMNAFYLSAGGNKRIAVARAR